MTNPRQCPVWLDETLVGFKILIDFIPSVQIPSGYLDQRRGIVGIIHLGEGRKQLGSRHKILLRQSGIRHLSDFFFSQ